MSEGKPGECLYYDQDGKHFYKSKQMKTTTTKKLSDSFSFSDFYTKMDVSYSKDSGTDAFSGVFTITLRDEDVSFSVDTKMDYKEFQSFLDFLNGFNKEVCESDVTP